MKWSTVRALGKVKYLSISYLVLIAVPLLAEIYRGIHQLTNYPQFPPPLKLVYAASLCYALAIALYQYFCPSVVKAHASDRDFLDSELDIHLRARPDKKLEIVLANLDETQNSLRDQLADLQAAVLQPLAPEAERKRQELAILVDSVYQSCVQRFLLAE